MNRIQKIMTWVLGVAGMAGMASCAQMHEDPEACPKGLYVRFVYDYNTQRADMFKDHVGHVKLYVYDEVGNKVAERDVSNTTESMPLRDYGFAIHFEDGELPDGKYRLQAVAMQNDWDAQAVKEGARFRRNDPQKYQDLRVELDREDIPVQGYEHRRVSNIAPLDTVWHTLKVTSIGPVISQSTPAITPTASPFSLADDDQMVEVRRDQSTFATISLIRNMKHINVTFRQMDMPEDVYASDYDVYVIDNNRTVNYRNEPASDEKLVYQPYHLWTTAYTEDGNEIVSNERPDQSIYNPKGHINAPRRGETRAEGDETKVLQRTAHYNFTTNRMVDDNNNVDNNARLIVYNRISGKRVVDINLPAILSEGRMAYDMYNYDAQQYLDREHDYHLQFIMSGDRWLYVDIVINTLNWAYRHQNRSL